MGRMNDTRGYHEDDWHGRVIYAADDGGMTSPNESYVQEYVAAKRRATQVVSYGLHEGDEPEPTLESGRTEAEEAAINATATTQADGTLADTGIKEGE